MKKVFYLLVATVIAFVMFTGVVNAAKVSVIYPSEAEIAPLRDFYVVGKIDRGGLLAKEQPLNVRIRLNNSKGEAVRLIESNVGPDGVTPGSYYLTDYENGTSANDSKNAFINTLTPPDIIYDGADRDSIRYAYNKIVVKENYFAAIVYGGASKDFDINYIDKYEKSLSDITEGEYELIITVLDLYGEEVCRTAKKLTVDNKNGRLIANGSVHIDEYIDNSSFVLPDSIVGYWNPSGFLENISGDFTYHVGKRFVENAKIEFSDGVDVGIFLNYLNTSDIADNIRLGTVFGKKKPNDTTYFYYDIGEETVKFNFADASLEKHGEIIESKHDLFINISRVENKNEDGDVRYIDFNLSDGVNLTVSDTAVFYGVYSPVNYTATLSGDTYKFNNKVANIQTVITNTDDEIVYENTSKPSLKRENSLNASEFEFSAEIEVTEELLSEEKLSIKFLAVDSNGEVLLESDNTELKLLNYGEFISGYGESYWGKMFCDTVNTFGQSPSKKPLEADSHITRGDFAALINRLLGYSVSGASKFSDLDKESEFYDDCITAQQIGYMTGDEKGRVNSENLISREEAIIILARISNAEKGTVKTEFKDSDKISFWAKDYVDTMCSTGIIAGFNGYLNPTDSITVAEAAALVIKTIKWMYSPDAEIKHNDIIDDETSDFSDVEIPSIELSGDFSEDNAEKFLRAHESAFSSVVSYLKKNCKDGAYINKVGQGLEIRDYKLGSFIKLSDNAIELLSQMSDSFVVFSVKYNPSVEDTISFVFGKTDEGKEFGIIYSSEDTAKNKKLKPIYDNWYYFLQK